MPIDSSMDEDKTIILVLLCDVVLLDLQLLSAKHQSW